jgi:uncharacterized protein (TIRG00374 family)
VSRYKSALVLFIKTALAALLVGWLWKSGRLDFSQFATLKIGVPFFALLFSQAAMLACIALRWHFLARACGLDFSLRQTLRISCIGNFAAVWTPAGLGLDGARLWQSHRLAPGQMSRIIASTFWDRALGVWAVLVLSALSSLVLLLAPLFMLSVQLKRTLWGVLIICLAFIVLPFVARRPIVKFLEKRLSHLVSKTSPAPVEFLNSSGKAALCFAFATHGCNALSLWFALQVLGAVNDATRATVLIVAPLVILSSIVPLTPLGLGVTDAVASTLLLAVGSSSGAEATMLGRVTFVLLSALCGIAWLLNGHDEH